jgi:hypothetical protein
MGWCCAFAAHRGREAGDPCVACAVATGGCAANTLWQLRELAREKWQQRLHVATIVGKQPRPAIVRRQSSIKRAALPDRSDDTGGNF